MKRGRTLHGSHTFGNEVIFIDRHKSIDGDENSVCFGTEENMSPFVPLVLFAVRDV